MTEPVVICARCGRQMPSVESECAPCEQWIADHNERVRARKAGGRERKQ